MEAMHSPSPIHIAPLPQVVSLQENEVGNLMGRLFVGIANLALAVLNVVIRIVRAIFSFFFPCCFTQSMQDEIPSEDKIPLPHHPKVKEKEELTNLISLAMTDFEGHIHEVFEWILSQPDPIGPTTKTELEQLMANAAKKSESKEVMEEGAYVRWLETLKPDRLKIYAQLLQTKGSPSPLFFHLQKEHQAAKLTWGSNLAIIGKRMAIIFSVLNKEHAEVLTTLNDFWNLIYIFPEEAAANLKPDVLAIIARNKSRHKMEFKRLIPRLPENSELLEKLEAIAPHASQDIELALTLKTERVLYCKFDIQDVPATAEQKTALKKALNKKIQEGLKEHRIEMAEKGQKAKEDCKTPLKTPAKKWVSATPTKKNDSPQPTPLMPLPKPQWPDENCISYLKNKKYQNIQDSEAEDIVFDWVFNKEHLFNDENLRQEVIDFVTHTLTNPLYLETTRYRLQGMSEDHLRYYVKLLGTERIEILWSLEATFGFSLSNEASKISRLKVVLASLSDEQFQASIQCAKFLEILRIHPKVLGPILKPIHWEAIAANYKQEEDILSTLAQMVAKMDIDEDTDFPAKLLVVSGLVKERLQDGNSLPRMALREEIERKLILCPLDYRTSISVILKEKVVVQ
jgi:hypothetical protein